MSINILQPAIANCNGDAIEKAMANIISNAIKYNKENGNIHLGVSKDNDHIKISVMDSGVGILKEDKAHLFDRFFRGKNTEHQPGSGIGLALTKAVIDAHGGTIQVESKTNVGSTFTIFLPIGKPSKKQKTTAKVSALADAVTPDNSRGFDPNTDINAFDSKKKTLLIVEDIPYILSYIVDTLNDKYNIVTAVNGQDGYEKALEQLPDLIISDIMMPVLNGYRLLEKVRADKLISHIPVIFLTAKIDKQSLEKSYGLTANDYIFKPFTQSQLLVRVESQLSHVDNIKSHYGLNSKIIVDDLLISKLDSFLSKNFSDEKLTIPDICNALAMSERNFQRKLKNLLGASPVEYLKKYRLERSRELMQSDKTLSIEALSEHCGFSSPGYFSVCFRKQYDISPSKYYKSLND